MPISRRDFVLAASAAPSAMAAAPAPSLHRHLRDDHDVALPDWGPYTNRYTGISHVADRARGLRFDLAVFPGFYRRKITIPHGRWESDFHPWESSADLDYYAFRHQLEWKDRVYCDASYSRIHDQARLVRCDCVNATSRPQNLVVHYMGYLTYPSPRAEVLLPDGARWVDALDYTRLAFATPRPTDNLTYDGLLRGEALDEGFVGGSGIGKFFGRERGDTVEYTLDLAAAIPDAVALLRYRAPKGSRPRLTFDPLARQPIELTGTGEFRVESIPCGRLDAGRLSLRIASTGAAPFDLDGFVLLPASAAPSVAFRPEAQVVHPASFVPGKRPNSLLLTYPGLDRWYGIAWNHSPSQIRQFFCAELEPFFRYRVQDHVSLVLRGPGDGHFSNVFLRPIPIAPKQNAVLHGMVCQGTRAEVERFTAEFPTTAAACESTWSRQRSRRVLVEGLPSGRSHRFGQQRLAADSLTNVMYPVYLKRHYITHTTPGRYWHMLYSWDAGFTGLGLLEVDLERSLGVLNCYLTRPGDEHAAFIHHGTPLPVQVYQFHEIWNRTRSRELLAHYYPRLRQYHNFLAGRLGSSSTRRLQSQLLQTWDYFYNTGWDDYPPQMYMHQHKLQKSLAPPVTTSHAIRTARILHTLASLLGETKDLTAYTEDIGVWTESLQRYAWDEESGYFGYVRHDASGRPQGILRHESGQNFNMGMCGAYPFFAGICSAAQEKRLVGHMMSPKRLWTRIGMTTVDQSAAYYRPDGYWNGAVWFPHQWFVWKALLDLGYAEEAHRIARTALDLWREEVDDTYGCFEHFMVDSGRGAGWHHFTSLSAPVLSWYASYYRPGRFTAGFDTLVEDAHWGTGNRTLAATLRMTGTPGREAVMLVVPGEGARPHATADGVPVPLRTLPSGAFELRVKNTAAPRKLAVG